MECKQKVMDLKEQEQTDKKKSQNLEKLLDVISSSKLMVKTNLPGQHECTKKWSYQQRSNEINKVSNRISTRINIVSKWRTPSPWALRCTYCARKGSSGAKSSSRVSVDPSREAPWTVLADWNAPPLRPLMPLMPLSAPLCRLSAPLWSEGEGDSTDDDAFAGIRPLRFFR